MTVMDAVQQSMQDTRSVPRDPHYVGPHETQEQLQATVPNQSDGESSDDNGDDSGRKKPSVTIDLGDMNRDDLELVLDVAKVVLLAYIAYKL